MARAIESRRSHLLLGALVVAHVVAISHQVDGGGGTSLLEHAVFATLSPLQHALAATLRTASGAWRGYVDLRGAREENRRLAERVRELETALQLREARAEEAGRLRELLDLRGALPLPTVAAEVLARDGLPWFRNVTIDKGSEDGVGLDAAVISPHGVVGRVVAVGPRAAKVQILLDRDCGVGVLVERSRVTGVVSGQVGFADSGTSDLVLKYVSALADVAPGDLVVTSGLDRIYPKGLVVGRVLSVGAGSGLFKEIAVAPSARFDRLEQVLVLTSRPVEPTLAEAVR